MKTAAPPVCPTCGHQQVTDFFQVQQVPVHVGFLWPDHASACAAPTGQILLAHCPACDLIWNRAFEPYKMSYGPGYEVSLHHSPTYQAFLEQQVARLTRQYGLAGKAVLEIGCGTGHFLQMLCRAGAYAGVGIDPCAPAEAPAASSVRFLQEAYGPQHAGLPADFIGIRQMFHVISRPRDVLDTLRENMGVAQRPVVYVEVPNGLYVIDRVTLWMVFYEQVAYYTPAALAGLFNRSGFDVLGVSPCYIDDQYLCLEAVPGTGAQAPPQGAHTRLNPDRLATFARRANTLIGQWRHRLEALADAGKTVVSWGSAGRGITFLNAARARGKVHAVVDINPDRQGRYIPGTGQQVIAPEALVDLNPDVVILTNTTYAPEIKQQVQALGLHPAFLSIEYEQA